MGAIIPVTVKLNSQAFEGAIQAFSTAEEPFSFAKAGNPVEILFK